MTLFPAIAAFLSLQGEQYQAPDKAGDLKDYMLDLRAKGQAARKEFQALAQAFAEQHPYLALHRPSQWMNQAQRLRPHFWVYLQAEGTLSQSMFALRLYGQPDDFGVSLEVSFLERKKDDLSLLQQNRVLNLAIAAPIYYLVQKDGESRKVAGTEENRKTLLEEVADGTVRKVLVKIDVDLTEVKSLESVLDELSSALTALEPYYKATRRECEE